MISYEGWDREYQQHKKEYAQLFDRFMSQSNYENCEQLEKEFAQFIGREFAVSVASATDALKFSLLSNNIGVGDEVLVTDFSWISSASCISMVGATPVFCDIDLDSYHISLDSIKRMTSDKTKALIYTHLFGNMSETKDIEQYCKEHNIAFIEDAAQSLGSSYNGRPAGTIGDCSSFSFNTNKVVCGINGGGVFLTDNEYMANTVKKLRRHGKDKEFEMLGYNSKMYVLNAEIIKFRLKHLEQNKQIRQNIAKRYNYEFEDLPVYTQSCTNAVDHNFHKYTVRFQDKATRDRVKEALSLSVHYEKPISDNAMYKNINYKKDHCVNAYQLSNTILSLPIHPWMYEPEILSIMEAVKQHTYDL